jgi:hypothetical protein
MSTIVTRAGKGSPLTHTEVDTNFTNLNTDKLQSGSTASSLVITSADINGGSIDGTTIGASTASTGAFTSLTSSSTTTLNGTTIPSSKTLVVTTDIGSTVQAYDAQLADVAGLTPTDNSVIIGNGTNFVVESGSTLRTSLGLAIGTDVQAYSAELQGATQGGIYGFKNRIINGAMVIDQRNAGASYTLTSSQTYTLDRFFGAEDTDGVMTVQQSSTAPTGFNFSALCTATTADASLGSTQHVYLGQKIEGFNTADLGWGTANAQTVTLSFWVRSSLTGTFGGSITNSAFSRSYPFSYTISSANTWEQKSVTIAGDTTGTWVGATNGAGIQLLFGLGVGSSFSGTAGAWAAAGLMSVTGAVSVIGTLNANWYITGVQLEKGSTATSFDYRPYGTELNLCQRYYYKAITGTLFNQLAFCNVRTTTSHYAFLQLPVTMRSNPSSVDYSTIGVIAAWGAGVTGLNSLTFANAAYGSSQTQVLLDAVTSGAVGTVGQISFLLGNNSATGFVALNAEL